MASSTPSSRGPSLLFKCEVEMAARVGLMAHGGGQRDFNLKGFYV
jgi:hypothetical protein